MNDDLEYVTDRLSAAREGVVKALEDIVDGWPGISAPDDPRSSWDTIRVTLESGDYLAARAALKEYQEASK